MMKSSVFLRRVFSAAFAILAIGIVANPACATEESPPQRGPDLTKIERKLQKEPQYQTAAPKYCLVVIGPQAETKVWLVQDGDTLYADLNGNGDLTDEGEKIAAEDSTFRRAGEYYFKVGDVQAGDLLHQRLYVLLGSVDNLATNFDSAKALLEQDPQARSYRVGLDMETPGVFGTGAGGKVVHGAGPIDNEGMLQFAPSAADAPIVHFGGPLQATLQYPQKLMIGRPVEVWAELGTPGLGAGTLAWMEYEGVVNPLIHPKLEITYPPATAGGEPVVQHFEIKHRCCTFSFHDSLAAPETAGPGEAKVTVSFPAYKNGIATPTTGTFDVKAARTKVVLEPVSPGITRELMHPNPQANLSGIKFSPDGTKLIAGDYPGGTVVLWDVATGKQLTEIHALREYRGTSEYFHVSPDWKRIYVAEENDRELKSEWTIHNGERVPAAIYQSYVRSWDLATGQPIRDFQHSPPRNIRDIVLLPDGENFISQYEGLSGVGSGRSTTGTLWNAITGESKPMPGDAATEGYGYGPVCPETNTLVIDRTAGDGNVSGKQELWLADAKTLQSRVQLELPEAVTQASVSRFINMGKVAVGQVRVYAEPKDYAHWKSSIRWWDTGTGKELARFDYPEENDDLVLYYGDVSADEKLLACASWRSPEKRLYVFDLQKMEMLHAMEFPAPEDGLTVSGYYAAISGDGKWLAFTTITFQPDAVESAEDYTALDFPQPRLHVIEAATGKTRKTLIAPQGAGGPLEFSPDGKTLAMSSHGRVLLWDWDQIIADIDTPTANADAPQK